MEELPKQTKKAIRQLIAVGRDRETAKLLQQADNVLHQPYNEGETTTDRFWKLHEWLRKKSKYMVDKYDCPNDCQHFLVTRLFNEGLIKSDDEPMTDDVIEVINTLNALIQR